MGPQAMISAAEAAQALLPPPSLDAAQVERKRLRQEQQQAGNATPVAPSPGVLRADSPV